MWNEGVLSKAVKVKVEVSQMGKIYLSPIEC